MQDLMKIKKYYGENMMHLCRELFPTLLEQDGLLLSILESKFIHSKYLYDDIVESDSIEKFRDYIYSLIGKKQELPDTLKTPKELLEEAGYILHECHNEDDIQFFVGYYDYDEELCTFNGGRLDQCHVFFAVKKNVDEINRWDFTNPQREDEYGTSVISIQFTRGENNTLSIKNRYNHTVENPDATYSNNLENIIPGLTRSFEREYNLNITQNEGMDFELPGYVKATNGKYYKYNYEINGIYYCPDNIVIYFGDCDEYFVEKEKYLIVDYFVIDLMKKKIYPYDERIKDSFSEGLQNIKKILITNEKDGKLIEITLEDDKKAYIRIDKLNRIIEYKNENLLMTGENFLKFNKKLRKIELPQVKIIGKDFLYENKELKEIDLPEVECISSGFLHKNEKISKVNLPKANRIGNNFLSCNKNLTYLDLPCLEVLSEGFLCYNEELKGINIPKVTTIENYVLTNNKKLTTLELPNVVEIYDEFLFENEELISIYLPNVKEIGHDFLPINKKLKTIYAPNLETTGEKFLVSNQNETCNQQLKSSKKCKKSINKYLFFFCYCNFFKNIV